MIRPLRTAVFLLLFLWCAGFSIPSLFNPGYYAVSSVMLNFFYSPVCHQLTHKSISSDSGSFLVCARCMGIYYGAALMSFILIFIKKIKTGFFLPALLIMFSDVILANTGVYSYSKTVSLLTGLFFGMTLLPYIIITLEDSLIRDEVK